jgi:hypothetical protein
MLNWITRWDIQRVKRERNLKGVLFVLFYFPTVCLIQLAK